MTDEFMPQELSYAVVETRDDSFILTKYNNKNSCIVMIVLRSFFFFTLSWRLNVPSICVIYTTLLSDYIKQRIYTYICRVVFSPDGAKMQRRNCK